MDPDPTRPVDPLPPPAGGSILAKVLVFGGGASALFGAMGLLGSHEGQLGAVAIGFELMLLGIGGFALLAGLLLLGVEGRDSLDAQIDRALASGGEAPRRPAERPRKHRAPRPEPPRPEA